MRLIDVDQIHHVKYHGIAEIYPSDVNIESYKRGWNDALDAVADHSCSPTIDAVPVIRCIECKHSDAYNHCTRLSIWNKPEDFCSYGERKES